VIFIKPEKEEEDSRTNNEIKAQLMEKLKKVKDKLKIRGMRQMRRKGIIIELDNKKDVQMLKDINLERIKLRKPYRP
jgi:hypothetical protein